jgi:hypothetical protein
MDPIHPILPVSPGVPTVVRAPVTGPVDRDKRRKQAADADRRAREERRHPADSEDPEDDVGGDGPHIDLTA